MNNNDNIFERNQAIKKMYLDGLAAKRESDSLIEEIADAHGIGKFYVRSILKDQNVEVVRKEQYSRKDEKQLQDRNKQIMDRFDEGIDPEVIADEFGLTVTRIRQLLKGKIVKSSKLPKLSHIKAEIESKIKDDVSYSDIQAEYGKSMIKQLRYNLEYNVFQEARAYMHANMVCLVKGNGIKSKKDVMCATVFACNDSATADSARQMIVDGKHPRYIANKLKPNVKVDYSAFIKGRQWTFISPDLFNGPDLFSVKEYSKRGLTPVQNIGNMFAFAHVQGPVKELSPDTIAKLYNVTRHYVYTLLHEHGVRFRLSKRDKEKRDKAIAAAYKRKVRIEKIADEHDLTPTMVRIILGKKKKATAVA